MRELAQGRIRAQIHRGWAAVHVLRNSLSEPRQSRAAGLALAVPAIGIGPGPSRTWLSGAARQVNAKSVYVNTGKTSLPTSSSVNPLTSMRYGT